MQNFTELIVKQIRIVIEAHGNRIMEQARKDLQLRINLFKLNVLTIQI